MSPGQDDPLYNSRNLNVYLMLAKTRYPHVDIDAVLDYAGMTRLEMADPAHWFTQEQVDRFYYKFAELTGNPELALEAGRFVATPEALGAMKKYVLGFLGPARTFEMIGKAAGHLVRSSTYSSRKIAANRVEIRVNIHDGAEEKPYQCLNRRGALEAVIGIFRCKLLELEHPECVFRGDDICRYVISWEKPLSVRLGGYRNYAVLLLLLFGPTAFFFSPQVAVYGGLLAGAIILLLGWLSEGQENRELKALVEDLQDPASRLMDQLDLSYNAARIANEVGQAISRQTGSNDILASVTAIMAKRLDYDRGMVLLALPDRTHLCYRGGYGFTDEQLCKLREHPFPLSGSNAQSPLTEAFHRQEPCLINTVKDLRNLSQENSSIVALLGTESFICCPIICEEESIGVLAVDHLDRKRDFTQSDVSLLMGIAPLIGIRISNADLMETQQQQRHEILTLEKAMSELSEAKKASERYAAELAEINEEIKNFTYIVSHDLRAPLVNIKGFSAELTGSMKEVTAAVQGSLGQLDEGEAKELALLLEEDIPEALDFINSSVQRMDTLINAILQLSRIGHRELKEERVDSCALVQKILKSLGHQMEKHSTEVSLGDLPEVTSDTMALEQLLGNLIDNAVKYLEPSRDGRLRIWTEQKKTEIVFHVGDNGRGIAAEDLEKIFTLFRRSGKQDVQGEGMGLAYVKTLARRLDGRIWCESQFGKGSTFSFAIPSMK